MCSYFRQQQALAKARTHVRKSGDWNPLDSAAESVVIRPTVAAETITAEGSQLRHWALVPAWSREPKLKYATFNARAETLPEKPAYRDAWKRSQRCLIPAISYSEYPLIEGAKRRHNIALANHCELMIAGLWSHWHAGEDDQRNTFTMITTAPLDQIAWVHNRSPLMLSPQQWDQWLCGAPEECLELLRPNDPGELSVAPA